jgi:GWxTD domain-containing protein
LFSSAGVSITHAQPSPAPQTSAPPAPQTPAPRMPAPAAVPAAATPAPQPPPEPAAPTAAAETPYENWMNEEVYWIITPNERSAFKKLASDDEREQFIEQFWLKRDPTPDTIENEYREEYYRRIAYVDGEFATNTVPGWKTDRGMIYIKYGPPNEREQHPAGGNYQRPIEEGGGTTTTYAFEKWRYRYLEGVGSNVTLEFVDPTGNGEYHLTSDPAEKDKLLYVPGAGLTLYEAMGLAEKSGRFTRTDGTHLGTGTMPLPASMDQFTRLQQFANLQKPPKPVVRPEDAVEDVVFPGARRIPQDTLRNLIRTHRGDKFDKDTVDQDVRALLNTKRFDDVTVKFDRGQTGWIVTFTVVERLVQAPK